MGGGVRGIGNGIRRPAGLADRILWRLVPQLRGRQAKLFRELRGGRARLLRCIVESNVGRHLRFLLGTAGFIPAFLPDLESTWNASRWKDISIRRQVVCGSTWSAIHRPIG